VTQFGELELLIHPSGVIPVATFLKDHHNGQFLNLSDIAGIDIPAKTNRFEVKLFYKIQKLFYNCLEIILKLFY